MEVFSSSGHVKYTERWLKFFLKKVDCPCDLEIPFLCIYRTWSWTLFKKYLHAYIFDNIIYDIYYIEMTHISTDKQIPFIYEKEGN